MKTSSLLCALLLTIGCASGVSQDQIENAYGGPQVRSLPFKERLDRMLSFSGPLSVREVDFLFGPGHHIVHGSQVAAALFLPTWEVAKMNKVTISDCPKGQQTGCEQHVMTKTEWEWKADGHKLFAIALVDPVLGGDRGAQWVFRLYADGAELNLKGRHYTALNPAEPIAPPPGEALPSLSDPFAGAPPEILQLRDSGLLVKLQPTFHRAYVTRRLWALLDPDRQKSDAIRIAEYCLSKAGGGLYLYILDADTDEQLGTVGDGPK